jgi:hypothetical protein
MAGRDRLLLVAALVAVVAPAWTAELGGQAIQPITLSAQIGSATRLRLSSEVLHIDASDGPVTSVVGTIGFDAAARTRVGGDVVLTVEALRDPVMLAGGAADADLIIEFAGTSDGLVPGTLSTGPRVAGRWTGSGVRQGRLVFTLRSAHAVAGGTVPLRFVLSTP